LNEEIRHLLRLELRHLQCRLSASALGGALGLFERAWSRGRYAALRSDLVLRIGAEALREDVRRLVTSLRAVHGAFSRRSSTRPIAR
jgi:hypothetical protein